MPIYTGAHVREDRTLDCDVCIGSNPRLNCIAEKPASICLMV